MLGVFNNYMPATQAIPESLSVPRGTGASASAAAGAVSGGGANLDETQVIEQVQDQE